MAALVLGLIVCFFSPPFFSSSYPSIPPYYIYNKDKERANKLTKGEREKTKTKKKKEKKKKC